MVRLVQIEHDSKVRRSAVVEDDKLALLRDFTSVYDLAVAAEDSGVSLESLARAHMSDHILPYDPIYSGKSEWRLLPPFDHPSEPARCLVSGTGLTHKKSAANRDAMHTHAAAPAEQISDSMKIYLWGAEGGRPPAGEIGIQPEWFYKGTGTVLRGHGDALVLPAFGDDGGEEPELAAAYLISAAGQAIRVGLMTANEFSDHRMERKNYLYLAPSKLRNCSIGPEIIVGAEFLDVSGRVAVERAGAEIWSHDIQTGEANMVHSMANLEHHHFKYPAHRRPGDAHIHFFGADAFSFGDGIALQDGDTMAVSWTGFGRTLRNTLRMEYGPPELVTVRQL